MGASSWNYIVPFQKDIAQALADLQRRVFDEGEYYRSDDYDIDYSSLEALFAARESDVFWDVGTHSILDIDQIIETGRPDEPGAIRALSSDETRALLGGEQPTRADLERAYNVPVEMGCDTPIESGYPRWSGRFTILYRDGVPDELAFWGYSGD